jgi:hypothetical protein
MMHGARERQGGHGCSAWIGLGSILAAVAGCTSPALPSVARQADAAPECAPTLAPVERPLPVITTLRTRDHELTVYASDEGLRFTVTLADGAVLGRQLGADELARSFPELHRRFDATFADERLGLDASVDPALLVPPGGAQGLTMP